jgi:glycosyltransferase involved in cell wall biosynthesis
MTLVTCIMPTADRRAFIPAAIRMFLAQDYPEKQLLIVDDGACDVEDLVPVHPQIRYIRRKSHESLGSKRNVACDAADGDIILHWDDDDWYAPWRLRYQVGALESGQFDVCGLNRVFFVDASKELAFEYVYPASGRPWVCGATLCYRKSLWEHHQFADARVGEDTRFIFSARGARVGVLGDNRFFVARIHPANTSPKRVNSGRFTPVSFETVRSMVGREWRGAFGGENGMPMAAEPPAGTALVTAASGIGDILRITPLVRTLHYLGFGVDVLLSPDDPAAGDLLRGSDEIVRLMVRLSGQRGSDIHEIQSLDGQPYDVATFTHWSAPLASCVKARQSYTFPSSWRREGDTASIDGIARTLGWRGLLPFPFAVCSDRDFGLPPGTVALHPGCKPDWPWKKWHGFGELALLFESVALVGTSADLDNGATYFADPFVWPERARNFVGKLDLLDTAALISQCSALISIDSGLMHLGVALGIPTFGIFGITSPERECMRSPLMIPITKGLPCEPACRKATWGRRDCEYHLECLKTLTGEEVAGRVSAVLAEPAFSVPLPVLATRDHAITLNYYGELFQASGYGQAARAYVRALHAAGVRVRVIDTGRPPHNVEDDFINTLIGHDPDADFNLFHGVPSFWARSAYRERNVIAMTVWEADSMPPMWRNPLTHAIDVWLPCTFNVEIFARDLGRTPFCLPHALPAPCGDGGADDKSTLRVEPTDFVFYSIFEWQDRKNPQGLIEAFFRAFSDGTGPVLLLKTGAGAADDMRRTLENARAQTHSSARVIPHCEFFDERLLRALHTRGDCYVSLHRGEGWGYPLFEAAAHGKPIIATAFGGPVDYLDPKRHWMVRCAIEPVRNPYYLYRSSMCWAEPDLDHACEGLRWVYEHRAQARALASEAARSLRVKYSLDAVGEAARLRLSELKQLHPRSGSARVPERETAQSRAAYRQQTPLVRQTQAPAIPIPGEWYDADYFERGLKSNWDRGYSWASFRGIFEETADLLKGTFADVYVYLDAGCAKGFLVQALRERGLDARGFDHSPWAIANAHPGAKPFLELATIDAGAYADRSVDVLVAMSLLEGLALEQIDSFLARARHWVRGALFATISRQNGRDRDLSHITVRDRPWWNDRFEEAGWAQSPAQRVVEQHPFPTRMMWDVYIFEPGQ